MLSEKRCNFWNFWKVLCVCKANKQNNKQQYKTEWGENCQGTGPHQQNPSTCPLRDSLPSLLFPAAEFTPPPPAACVVATRLLCLANGRGARRLARLGRKEGQAKCIDLRRGCGEPGRRRHFTCRPVNLPRKSWEQTVKKQSLDQPAISVSILFNYGSKCWPWNQWRSQHLLVGEGKSPTESLLFSPEWRMGACNSRFPQKKTPELCFMLCGALGLIAPPRNSWKWASHIDTLFS